MTTYKKDFGIIAEDEKKGNTDKIMKDTIKSQNDVKNVLKEIDNINLAIDEQIQKKSLLDSNKPIKLNQTKEEILAKIALKEANEKDLVEFNKEYEKYNKSLDKYKKDVAIVNETISGLNTRKDICIKQLSVLIFEAKEKMLLFIYNELLNMSIEYKKEIESMLKLYEKMYNYCELMDKLSSGYKKDYQASNIADADGNFNYNIDKNLLCSRKSAAVGCEIKIPMFRLPVFDELFKSNPFGYFPISLCSKEAYEAVKKELENNGIDYDLICG